jgi:hypothetical protein
MKGDSFLEAENGFEKELSGGVFEAKNNLKICPLNSSAQGPKII